MTCFRRLFFLILTLIIISSCSDTSTNNSAKASYPESLVQLQENVLKYYVNLKAADRVIEDLLPNLEEDGSWSNIDYTNKIRGGWPVKNHLKYVQTLAINYKNETSKYYLDKNLSKKIHKSLNF